MLDKIDALSFGIQDMELLGMFARQAAIAIFQSQQYDLIGEALLRGIKELSEEDPSTDLADILHDLAATSEKGDPARELFVLADLINSIRTFGEAEREMCLRILSAFADYLRSKPILP